jgi:thiol-disulfide isomerase/thioredoxin
MKLARFAFLFAVLIAGLAHAEASKLPDFNGPWVNDGPYTAAGLKGKAVVLYFFEEGCPSCRARWPGMIELKKKYENEPVLFIGVNSGNTKANVSSYVKGVNSDWATYVDADRSFEKNFGFEISLQNIYQMMVADADGNLSYANSNSPDAVIERAAKTATWKVPPTDIPEALKKAWRALEFGQTSVAAPIVKQALGASDAKVKEAAKKMETTITSDIQTRLTDAKTKLDAGDKWGAFKAYSFVAENYKDFAEAKPAIAESGKLRNDTKVAKEIQAKTAFEKCVEWSQSQKKSEKDQAAPGFKYLADNFADTEYGALAKGMK